MSDNTHGMWDAVLLALKLTIKMRKHILTIKKEFPHQWSNMNMATVAGLLCLLEVYTNGRLGSVDRTKTNLS